MSSLDTVNIIDTYLNTELDPIKVFDVDALFGDLEKYLLDNGVNPLTDSFVALQFFPGEESPREIGATSEVGSSFQETGGFLIHVCTVAKSTSRNTIRTIGETIRNILRGKNLNGLLILSLSTINFEDGATLEFEDGFTSGTIQVSYRRDFVQT